MEIKIPKEMVSEIVGTPDNKESAFRLKSKSTLNGAFFGGALGFIVAHQSKKSLYLGILIGALTGAFINNLLTVRKNESL
jgi:hypothetical protein